MRSIARPVVAAFAILISISSAARAQANTAARTEVEKAVHELAAAYGGEPAMLDKYFGALADDFIIVGASGRQTRQEYESRWRQRVAEGGGMSAAAVRSLHVQMLSNDVAVATYEMAVTRRGPLPPGRDRDIVEWMSLTLMKQPDRRWLVKSMTYILPAPTPAAAAAAAPAAR